MMKTAVLIAFAFAGSAFADTSSIRHAQLEFLEASASASGGATARRASVPESDKEAFFKSLDINGDGSVSKAEAAGHAPVTLAFDKADRNRDGKLSKKEYDNIGKAAAKKATRQARGKGDSASAGGTRAKAKSKKD